MYGEGALRHWISLILGAFFGSRSFPDRVNVVSLLMHFKQLFILKARLRTRSLNLAMLVLKQGRDWREQ